jgi:hypothetical protein
LRSFLDRNSARRQEGAQGVVEIHGRLQVGVVGGVGDDDLVPWVTTTSSSRASTASLIASTGTSIWLRRWFTSGTGVGVSGCSPRAVVAASAELQERDALKSVGLAAAMTAALVARGVADPTAHLAAEMGVLAFKRGYAQWSEGDRDDGTELA